MSKRKARCSLYVAVDSFGVIRAVAESIWLIPSDLQIISAYVSEHFGHILELNGDHPCEVYCAILSIDSREFGDDGSEADAMRNLPDCLVGLKYNDVHIPVEGGRLHA
jgi:hypothetical protein